jgi:hypothetical protein
MLCMLTSLHRDRRPAACASAPAIALACRKISTQLLVDANGSGPHDVVPAVLIQSNRANFEVTEALVYLSDPHSESGYCYSAQASRELVPENLLSAEAASAALRQARVRLGLQAFACDR